MKKIIIVISNGFEEIEAITIIDICRRARLDITIAAVEELTVVGAHDIKIIAEVMIENVDYKEYDMVVLPGGLPNAFTLAENQTVQNFLKNMKMSKRNIAAICAAPFALHTAGVLNEHYTCYPSFEEKINPKGYDDSKEVVIDGDVMTSKGPATAMEFALQIVKLLCNNNRSNQIKQELLYKP